MVANLHNYLLYSKFFKNINMVYLLNRSFYEIMQTLTPVNFNFIESAFVR